MSKQIGTFSVNGRIYERIIEPHMLLVDVLRDELGLTGTKRACGSGACGACTVLMNGKPQSSCLTLALRATDQPLQTVEGLAEDQQLHPLQQAFIDNLGAQCGYCTAGMMLCGQGVAGNQPHAYARRGHSRAGRQPVPLHRLREDHRVGLGCRAAHAWRQ